MDGQEAPTEAPTLLPCRLLKLRVDGLTKPKLSLPRKYYVSIAIDPGKEYLLRSVELKDNALVWNDPSKDRIDFDASLSSKLILKLYRHNKGAQGLASFTRALSLLLRAPASRSYKIENSPQTADTLTLSLAIEKRVQPSRPSQLSTTADMANNAVQAMSSAGPVLSGIAGGGDTAQAVVNQLGSMEDAFKAIVIKLGVFTDVVDSLVEIHPYAEIGWKILSAAFRMFKDQLDQDEKVHQLLDKMNAVYEIFLLADDLIEREAHRGVLKRLALQTVECGHSILNYAKDKSLAKRTLSQAFGNMKTIDYDKKFDSLRDEFLAQTNVETEILVIRVTKQVEKFDERNVLDDLLYARGAGYGDGPRCLPGTRSKVLDDIEDWIINGTTRGYLICGPAGTGKSTVARTIAARFSDMKRLGSCFCFNMYENEQRTPEHLFPTIARDLADFDEDFSSTLCRRIRWFRADRTSKDLATQLKALIIEPFRTLDLNGPILLVIDGLDQSGEPKARRALLNVLSECLKALPEAFRILLTSRGEPDVLGVFQRLDSCDVIATPTLEEDKSLFDGIVKFLEWRLQDTSHLHGPYFIERTTRS